jgi:hypothetical protein
MEIKRESMKTIAQAVGAELSDAAADAIAAVVEKRMRDLINVRRLSYSVCLCLSLLTRFVVLSQFFLFD